MLRRDYLLRLVADISEAVYRLLHSPDRPTSERLGRIESLYRLMGLDPWVIRSQDAPEILLTLAAGEPESYMQRVEAAAILLSADAMLQEGNPSQQRSLAMTALELFRYIDDNSGEYSVEREGYIETLRTLLSRGIHSDT